MMEPQYYVEKNETESLEEYWAHVARLLQKKGLVAEFTTKLEVRPYKPEQDATDKIRADRSKPLIQNILRKRSHALSMKLREEFKLETTVKKPIQISLDGALSEYSGDEDSVELVRSARKRY